MTEKEINDIGKVMKEAWTIYENEINDIAESVINQCNGRLSTVGALSALGAALANICASVAEQSGEDSEEKLKEFIDAAIPIVRVAAIMTVSDSSK